MECVSGNCESNHRSCTTHNSVSLWNTRNWLGITRSCPIPNTAPLYLHIWARAAIHAQNHCTVVLLINMEQNMTTLVGYIYGGGQRTQANTDQDTTTCACCGVTCKTPPYREHHTRASIDFPSTRWFANPLRNKPDTYGYIPLMSFLTRHTYSMYVHNHSAT